MSWKQDNARAKRAWVGPLGKYDLITEGSIALVVVIILLVVLSALFGAPKVDAISFQSWAQADPSDFVATTLTELAGTSETATYGPPYNDGTGQVQDLGPFSPQTWAGVRIPVNAPQDFVIGPLTAFAPLNPDLQQALQQWTSADVTQQQAWANAASAATLTVQGSTVSFDGTTDTGPIVPLMSAMLAMAQSGALDSQSVNAPSDTYSMNYTKSLLYTEDGNYMGDIASYYHMLGEQWGIMNEIGSWPGQPWLLPYAMWYNTPPWSNVGTDILAVFMFSLVLAIVFFLPFIPGLRSLPRALRLYRLIWRPYYRKYGREVAPKA